MKDIDKVVEELKEELDLCKKYFQEEDMQTNKSDHERMALKISCDYMQTLDVAIQTIEELQSQIPKYHYVADGDLPGNNQEVLCAYQKISLSGSKIDTRWSIYIDGKFKSALGMNLTDNVIAWMKLPKFESEE